ncbi:hypothetical protein IJD34_08500 [bacterium]|nr:hypothetical protein [bacterium]
MKISPDTKVILSKVEIKTLEELANGSIITKNNIIIDTLLERFNAFSIETLLRKVDFYDIVKITNEEKREFIYKTAAIKAKKHCEYRKQLLSLGFECPHKLCDFFYDIFRHKDNNDEQTLKIEADKLRKSAEVKEYFANSEKYFNKQDNSCSEEIKNVLNRRLAQKIDRQIAVEMSNLFNNKIAGLACFVRNYIDDNCPIYITETLTENEALLLDFLSNQGDVIDYALTNKTDISELFSLIDNLQTKFKTNITEEVLLFNLIETRYRKDNLGYINILLNMNILNSTQNLETLGKMIAPQERFKILQMKKNLESLKAEIPNEFEGAQYKRLCDLMTLKQEINL